LLIGVWGDAEQQELVTGLAPLENNPRKFGQLGREMNSLMVLTIQQAIAIQLEAKPFDWPNVALSRLPAQLGSNRRLTCPSPVARSRLLKRNSSAAECTFGRRSADVPLAPAAAWAVVNAPLAINDVIAALEQPRRCALH
jgi:hypothetical protein